MIQLTSPSRFLPFPTGQVPSEARAADSGSAGVLARMLDVVDYGMLLVVGDGCVTFANQIARAELNADHPLQMLGDELRARCARDVVSLHTALAGALQRGVHSLLRLGGATGPGVHVAVVPIGDAGMPAAAVILGKRRVCEDLSSDAYARQHGLTLAESRVLRHLCAGERPQDIAFGLGVKLSTVRTQISSIRAKTGARDIGAILQRVARLPPLPCLTQRGC